MLLKGGASLDLKAERSKPHNWLQDTAWLHLCQLSRSNEPLREICNRVQAGGEEWQAWVDVEAPETSAVPDYEGRLNAFQKLCLIRSLREDRLLMAAKDYIMETLGKKYLVFKPLDIEATWLESTTHVPMIFLLSPGSNPNSAIALLATRRKIEVDGISMGQGQEVKALQLLQQGFELGRWVLLQNTHLGLGFMNTIESKFQGIGEIHEDFRLWITSEPHPLFPIGLLQMSIKMTDEPPSGLKAGLRKSYAWLDTDWIEAVSGEEWRSSLFALCFMHSVVQERRKFGPLGWNIPYEFNQSDLEAASLYMKWHMGDAELRKAEVSWNAVQYMTCEVQYGGRITDGFDRRLFNTYGQRWLCPRIFDNSFEFGDPEKAPGYRVLKYGEISRYRSEIENQKDDDHPEVFGMHGNADLTFRTKQTKEALDTIINIQPKDSGGGGGMSREQVVREKAAELLQKIPASFVPSEVRGQLQKLNGGGAAAPKPLNIHLKQEVDRMSVALKLTRTTLSDLELAIAGTIIMSEELIEALNYLFDARVPPRWLAKSWMAPTVGLWFGSLVQRTKELSGWLEGGRPKAYWLTGFFNAQGFLTAVQQEVTRRHNGWSLDNVSMHTKVSQLDKEAVDKEPRVEEGVYIWGLFLDGASWDHGRSVLVDQPPKQLFCEIPCMFVTALDKKEKDRAAKEQASYQCPVYTIPARTGLYFIFTADVASVDPEWKWILRGVALMCSTT